MKKLLFVNCCIRESSRTQRLCRAYLAQLGGDYEQTELRLPELPLSPFNAAMLERRTQDIADGRLDGESYALARQFAEADRIVIGAPYWDAFFPSLLKVYIEHICVESLTLAYGDAGRPVRLCRAESLTYITTAGGCPGERPGVQRYLEELCAILGMDQPRFYCAQGLDIHPDRVEELLAGTLERMQADICMELEV